MCDTNINHEMTEIDTLFLYTRSFLKTKEQLMFAMDAISKKKKEKLSSSYFLEQIHKINKECLDRSKRINKLFKKYQLTAIQYITTHRGLICAFDVGTGKTLTAVGACYTIYEIAKLFYIKTTFLIITPTSLQHNFKKEMELFGMDSNSSQFIFYTTAKFAIEYKKGNIHWDNMILVIDEAHVFRTDYRSIFSEFVVENSKDNTRAECAVECASFASKVLLLTATPIYNRTHDIVNLISMVRGVYPPYEKKPEDLAESDFKRIYGKSILFQKADTTLFDEKGNRIYPERRNILVKVVMTPRYLKKYEKLEEEIKQKKGKDEKSNAFNVLMRQSANDMDESIKLEAVMEIILKNKKTILYSEFLSKGLLIVQEELKKRGIPFFNISGDTTMTRRKKIVEEMNSINESENSKGGGNDKPKLILITKAGGEGLDFKGIRKVILFEKGWNVSVEEQVIGRAIRYKSHIHLPPNKQNVKVYAILALKPYYIDFEDSLKNLLEKHTPPKFSQIDYNGNDLTLYKIIIKNEEFVDQRRRVMPKNSKIENIGVDLNMYVQALLKEKENIILRERLEKEQIVLADILSPEDYEREREKSIFDRSHFEKLPLSRLILLPFPEKGFHKKTKKIECFEKFHGECKKYGSIIDMLFGGLMDGIEYDNTFSSPLSKELIDYLPVDTSTDKYLIDILRMEQNDSISLLLFERNEIVRMERDFFMKYLSPSYTKHKIYFLMMHPLHIFMICDRSQPKNIFCSSFFISPGYIIERLYNHSLVQEDLFFSFITEIEGYARKTLKAEKVIFSMECSGDIKKDRWGVGAILESAGYTLSKEISSSFFRKDEDYSFFHL